MAIATTTAESMTMQSPAADVLPEGHGKDEPQAKKLTRVAYLVNQYPQTNVSFIRREILSLEAQGINVERYAVRSWDQELVDPGDIAEKKKTKVVLSRGIKSLVPDLLRIAIARPMKFLRAIGIALKTGWKSDRGILFHLVYLAEACRIAIWCQRDNVEWIHSHFGTNSTTVAMFANALGGPPYSFTAHGPEEFDRPGPLKLAEKIKRASFVVGISSFTRSQLWRLTAFNEWDKIHVVRCGVDDTFRGQKVSPAKDDNCSQRFKFICVSRLHEQKGLPVLIRAAQQLASEGYEFEVTLVGDGPLRSEIENQIERFDLQDFIHLAGWKNGAEVRELLLESNAFVLPSFAEGLPVVLMESLSMARPVITTYIAGIRELVVPGESGWLVPAGSVGDLVAAMRQAIQTPQDQLESMGESGAERVSQMHNSTTEAAKLLSLFQKYHAMATSST